MPIIQRFIAVVLLHQIIDAFCFRTVKNDMNQPVNMEAQCSPFP